MEDLIGRVARAIMEANGGCLVTDWEERHRNPNVMSAWVAAEAAVEATAAPALLAFAEGFRDCMASDAFYGDAPDELFDWAIAVISLALNGGEA